MEIRTLVVTSDAGERARLTLLFDPRAGDLTAVALRFASTLDEARCRPQVLDLLLLVPAAADGARYAALPADVAGFDHVPIVIVGDAIGMASAREALTSGLADDVMLSTDSRLDTLARFATTVERAHSRARHWSSSDIVLAAMADAVITTDAAGAIGYCNDAACHLILRGRDQMLGARLADVMALHDAGTLAVIEHPIVRVLRDKHIVRLPPGVVMMCADGSEIMIADST